MFKLRLSLVTKKSSTKSIRQDLSEKIESSSENFTDIWSTFIVVGIFVLFEE